MSNLEYVNWINELELTEDDKEFLLQDEHFQDVYEQYAEQDIELNDIEVVRCMHNAKVSSRHDHIVKWESSIIFTRAANKDSYLLCQQIV